MEQQDWTMTDLGTVNLAGTTYQVEEQVAADGHVIETWLTGPRGATYFLRPYLGNRTGLHQVISWKSGSELRKLGNEIRVIRIGDFLEQHDEIAARTAAARASAKGR